MFVADLLGDDHSSSNADLARKLEGEGYHLRISRDLETAKAYLAERYREAKDARFGLLASSKDRDLQSFGVPNDFQSTKRVRLGRWYAAPESDSESCRQLRAAVTEFGAQGLELDAALLAWGTDLIRADGRWSNLRARGYRRGTPVRDPFQLRLNAYRVLLTRGRDATVVFMPPIFELDETYRFFVEQNGFLPL